ncbi:MAG: alanine--tRNA ligase [Planctomycetaceae bacterium]|nr:alanine--tRNA ligase [Planctomycetaceae bacterium]|tara:strand:- start:971 stop:3778 length:2808 start_codon:yes stop_codon:yes gene_type:complete
MKTNEIREKYLSFYESKGHTRCASDVLVPTWDPSVLFTPAGMNPFKDHFLGKVKLDFTRATSSQKCLRTGDIDNVGRTSYHHTFFEMLGNFSFGDYFKREAITWAWEFLTDPKWLGLQADRLTVTVYLDDDEAAKIWHDEVGIPTNRITRMGEDDNFWPAGAPSGGPDGVCGPCSEIFYLDPKGEEVEIWNLVFTQFNRIGNPPDNLHPLPSKNIDTGMGLERIASVMQGQDTNYHIDILRPIVEAAGEIVGLDYDPASEEGRRLRRICDHVRACTFAVHENVYPGPNKEKYVIRRLLRRAVLDGHQMGKREPFLYQLVSAVTEQMKTAYPELCETSDRVESVIKQEENAFLATLDDGLARIDSAFAELKSTGNAQVPGTTAADLYQTYGVPPELVESMASDLDLGFDWDGFREAMEQHGLESGKTQFELFKTGPVEGLKETLKETQFHGYEQTTAEAEIKGLIVRVEDGEDQLHESLEAGEQKLILVTDATAFYGESGGQVGDSGTIENEHGSFIVEDTQKDGDLFLHYGYLQSGVLTTGQTVHTKIDIQRRDGIRRAHSATHILHHALQNTLGSHAQQQGSKVDEDWLRFDFTNMEPVSDEQLLSIEQQVQQLVSSEQDIQWQTLPLADARAQGAMMLFGEKYPDPVRMVSIGEFSKELCGGTHLTSTSEVGDFQIASEEGVAAGTRRITALTGTKAATYIADVVSLYDEVAAKLTTTNGQLISAVEHLTGQIRDLKKHLSNGNTNAELESCDLSDSDSELSYVEKRTEIRSASRMLNVASADLLDRVESLLAEKDKLQMQLEQLKEAGDVSSESLLEKAVEINGTSVVVAEANGANPGLMRQLIDQIRKQVEPSAVLLLASQGDDKVVLVAGVSRELVKKGANAGNWVREVAPVVGGGGGGKPDMAQAGGKDPAQIPAAIEKAIAVISEMLK